MSRSVLVLGFICGLSSGIAHAQKCESAAAKKNFAEAKKSYDLGEYQQAIALWEQVYAECPSSWVLFNLAQSHRMIGNKEKAITLYRSWLRETTDADPAMRKEVEERVSELAAQIAAQKETAIRPPTGVADDVNANRPLDTGRPERPQPVDSSPSGPRWYQDTLGWTLAGGGLAIMVGGGVLFLHGNSLRDDAASEPDVLEVERMIDSAGTYRTVGGVMFWAGAALTVAGSIKLVLHDDPRDERRDIAVTFGPNGVAVQGRF